MTDTLALHTFHRMGIRWPHSLHQSTTISSTDDTHYFYSALKLSEDIFSRNHMFDGPDWKIMMYCDCDYRNGAFNLDVINADFVSFCWFFLLFSLMLSFRIWLLMWVVFLRLLFQLFHSLMPLLCKFIDLATFAPTCPSKQMTLLHFLLYSCGAPLYLQTVLPLHCTWGKRLFSMLKCCTESLLLVTFWQLVSLRGNSPYLWI